MKTFKKGGIHPAADKTTADCPVKRWENRGRLLSLMLSQCIGAPSVPLKKAGDTVEAGEMVAQAGGFVGAPIHSPVNGTVKKIEKIRDAQGLWKEAMLIEASDFELPHPSPRSAAEIEALTPKEIVDIIGEAGIVGLGGATFPTRVKLTPPEGKVPEVILINGAECEPVLTCDDRLMREHAREILQGTRLLMRAAKVSRAIVGIEENKPEAILKMRQAAQELEGIEVVVLKKKYPQGGEKQLIQALTGREVPDGGLPVDVGAIVDNVATAYAVQQAVYLRLPLTHRVVTVAGNTPHSGNWLVANGTPVSEFVDMEALPEERKFIAGGPMMGRAMAIVDTPATKGFSGLIVKTKDVERKPSQNCIRCGRCIDVCPMGLEPYLLMLLCQADDAEALKARHVLSCIECGSCQYTCPSCRPLLDFIRLGKRKARNA